MAAPIPPRAAPALPTRAYTPWFTRVLAFLADWVPIWVLFLVPTLGLLIEGGPECVDSLYASGDNGCATAVSGFWLSVQVVGSVVATAYFFWNICYRQGRTGQSIGKSLLKFKLVGEQTWRPIGFWRSLLRQIAHYVDQLALFLGYLWPLWDHKRQTFADKIMHTVCVALNTEQVTPITGRR